MVEKFEFPDTGEGVTEGKFLEWEIEVGDEIEEDQIVGKAETDKAVVEIPSPTSGTVKDLKVSPGDNVEVGEVIMDIETSNSVDQETEATNEEKSKEATEEQQKDSEEFVDPVFGGGNKKESSSSHEKSESNKVSKVLALPKVRKLAEEKNIDIERLGSKGERVTEKDVLTASKSNENIEKDTSKDSEQEVLATPSVRKLARKKEVDLTKIEGSGKGGKILREDILSAKEDNKSKDEVENSASVKSKSSREENIEVLEMSNIRKSIASKMSKSRFTAPHVTHMDKADVTKLVELREEMKEELDVHLTYLPFIMKAVYLAMEEYPKLNSELRENEDEILIKKFYDFNIAVDTERGLMVPKVENVDEKSIIDLAENIGEIVEKTREGNLSKNEMSGGTFSLTNIGVLGGEEFTPIINYPQTAILGIGSIKETAEVYNGDIAKRNTVKLSLSFDHRVIDGATAARFTSKVIELLENPNKMLVELE